MNQTYSLIDKSIAIIIVLFVLSLISERFITWVKLYFFKKGNVLLWTFFNWEEDYSTKSDDPVLEKERERRILLLNIILSIIIALLANANIFKILQAPSPFDALGWKSNEWEGVDFLELSIIKSFSGCILGGLFISLGSKFWHDTLDMLFHVKNLKSKLYDERTYQQESIEQLDEYLNLSSADLVNLAIHQNYEFLKSKLNIVNILHGKKILDGLFRDCVTIHLSDNSVENMPKMLPVKLPSGKVESIEIEYIIDVDKPRISIGSGDSIANKTTQDFKGTISCAIQNKKNQTNYLLTCSHVMTAGSGENMFGTVFPSESVLINDEEVGEWVWALRNDKFDIALIKLESIDNVSNIVQKKARILNYYDIKKTKVFMDGFISNNQTGVVINYRTAFPIDIEYEDNTYQLNNLILFSKMEIMENGEINYKALSQPGDSGAIVYDEDKYPVAIVIAGNSKFTYAISIDEILTKTNCQII